MVGYPSSADRDPFARRKTSEYSDSLVRDLVGGGALPAPRPGQPPKSLPGLPEPRPSGPPPIPEARADIGPRQLHDAAADLNAAAKERSFDVLVDEVPTDVDQAGAVAPQTDALPHPGTSEDPALATAIVPDNGSGDGGGPATAPASSSSSGREPESHPPLFGSPSGPSKPSLPFDPPRLDSAVDRAVSSLAASDPLLGTIDHIPTAATDSETQAPTVPRPASSRRLGQAWTFSLAALALTTIVAMGLRVLTVGSSAGIGLLLLPALSLSMAATIASAIGRAKIPRPIAVPAAASAAALLHGASVFALSWSAHYGGPSEGSIRTALAQRLSWLTGMSGFAVTVAWVISVIAIAIIAAVLAYRLAPATPLEPASESSHFA